MGLPSFSFSFSCHARCHDFFFSLALAIACQSHSCLALPGSLSACLVRALARLAPRQKKNKQLTRAGALAKERREGEKTRREEEEEEETTREEEEKEKGARGRRSFFVASFLFFRRAVRFAAETDKREKRCARQHAIHTFSVGDVWANRANTSRSQKKKKRMNTLLWASLHVGSESPRPHLPGRKRWPDLPGVRRLPPCWLWV